MGGWGRVVVVVVIVSLHLGRRLELGVLALVVAGHGGRKLKHNSRTW